MPECSLATSFAIADAYPIALSCRFPPEELTSVFRYHRALVENGWRYSGVAERPYRGNRLADLERVIASVEKTAKESDYVFSSFEHGLLMKQELLHAGWKWQAMASDKSA